MMPVDPPPNRFERSLRRPTSVIAPACILNVDNDEASRRLKSLVLQSAGFRTIEADTGPQAFDAISLHSPALVLLDVNLPGFDGFEVCRRIKADRRTRSIPVVHISAARVADADLVHGLEAGADTYLVAPVDPAVLIATIRSLLQRSQVEHGLRAEQEHAADALRASERRYREVFLHAPYGIYSVALDGRVLSANHALARMLGYDTPDDLTALNAASFHRDPSEFEEMLAGWRQQAHIDEVEERWRTRAGRDLVVRLTGRRLTADAGGDDTFEIFVADLTEQRRLEMEIRQTHKMEAIGRLAAGIAHDFNNLLTAILGYTDLMLEQIGADKPIHGDLMQVQGAAETAASLTRQLLAFGRKQQLQVGVVDVNDVVRTSEHLLRRVIGEDVQMVLDVSPNLQALRGDRIQLEQVLVNLAVNARDAMASGGTLTIHTANVELADPLPFPLPVRVRPGLYIYLAVTDTGCGMSAETLDHLFEPFFTTKELGRGTGLGLSTVYGIVSQLDGYIWVSSEPQKGTTFHLYFPVTDADDVTVAPSTAVRPAVCVGRESVLVVEDDRAVRALVSSVLSRHGYSVVTAANPAQALALAASKLEPFELVLVDVILPGMSGPALVEQLEARGPCRAIFMSAYSRDAMTLALIDETSFFLPKPFKQTDLLSVVRLALDQPATIAERGDGGPVDAVGSSPR